MHSIVKQKLDEVAVLCVKYHAKRLELFGSAVRDDFDVRASDIDFVVEFKKLSPKEHANAYFGLIEELELIFDRPVDLVERRAIKNPYFLQAVDQERIEIYAAA